MWVGNACKTDSPSPQSGKVSFAKDSTGHYQVYRGTEVFTINGVSGRYNLPLLKECGGNTIRTYDTTHLASILDEADSLGIAVVAGIWLPIASEDWFYRNEDYIAQAEQNLKRLGEKYRNHPALLSWVLGNELIFYDALDFNFPRQYAKLFRALKQSDPNHPIGTAIANVGQKAMLNWSLKFRDLDYLLFNTFGRLKSLKSDLKHFTHYWDKPFFIGEFGEVGPWEATTTRWGVPLEMSSNNKAYWLRDMYYQQIPSDHPNFLGAMAFYWGWRQEQTHTWFNVFDEEGRYNDQLYVLREVWKGDTSFANSPPVTKRLLLEDCNNPDSLVFSAGRVLSAELEAFDPDGDSLSISWSVRTEDWLWKKAETPPALFPEPRLDSTGFRASFTAPAKPGPYRLFVKLSDYQGHFSTINLPFYVVP